jgi:hypothetical protein
MIPQWEDDAEAMTFLRARGYRLTPAYEWIPPLGREPTEQEQSAASYLFEEWDFGGINKTPQAAAEFETAREMTRRVFTAWIDRKMAIHKLSHGGNMPDIPAEVKRLLAAVKLARQYIKGQQIEHALIVSDDNVINHKLSLGAYLDRAISVFEK